MKMTTVGMLTTLATCLSLAACSGDSQPNEETATDNILASYTIENHNGLSRISAKFNYGGINGKPLTYEEQDKVIVAVNNTEKPLSYNTLAYSKKQYQPFNNDANNVAYQANIQIEKDQQKEPISMSLYRAHGEDAINSSVVLPEEFSIYSPQSGEVYAASESIAISWQAPQDIQDSELRYELSCRQTNGEIIYSGDVQTIQDDGNYSLDISNLSVLSHQDLDTQRQCDLNIQLARPQQGQVDEVFLAGSQITAYQVESISRLLINPTQ
ncbi:hypothetical protein C2869_01845 [Saccharobesus litoralis]|uniref:Lipoprotein n=1 Tax=Saccharobesus litoralis TaxID=2172099 RepID=A0A2S0VM29_9ALTE|nr:hypothetical protein [Saccharobesus litoralis]AWB65263.1 hypothetical protein C2869_01845 [Saccharobesus litoralis]